MRLVRSSAESSGGCFPPIEQPKKEDLKRIAKENHFELSDSEAPPIRVPRSHRPRPSSRVPPSGAIANATRAAVRDRWSGWHDFLRP